MCDDAKKATKYTADGWGQAERIVRPWARTEWEDGCTNEEHAASPILTLNVHNAGKQIVETEASSYGLYRHVNTNYTQLSRTTSIVQQNSNIVEAESWSIWKQGILCTLSVSSVQQYAVTTS